MQYVSRYHEATNRATITAVAQQNTRTGNVWMTGSTPSRVGSRKIIPLARQIPAASDSRTVESQILCSSPLAGNRKAVKKTAHNDSRHNAKATGLTASCNMLQTS